MGETVLEKLQSFPVCTVSGDPGTGKSQDVPPSILGTLMERDVHGQLVFALILELKEARNALYDHMQEEHSQIAPWVSIWNGHPNGHVWPQVDSSLVLCSPVSLFNRILGASGAGKDVTYKIYDVSWFATPR